MDTVFPTSLVSAVSKRQADVLAGRYVAQKALNEIVSGNPLVGKGLHRTPYGVIGSISHTSEIAICAVSNQDDNDYLGVDIQCMIDEGVVNEIKSLVLGVDEENYLLQVGCAFPKFGDSNFLS